MTESTAPPAAPPKPPTAGLAPTLGERTIVGFGCLLQALVWGWAATNLPWQNWSLFSVAAGVLAIASGGTAVASLVAVRWFLAAWRATSWIALAHCLLSTWIAASSGLYLSVLYGQLGKGIFAILAAIWGLAVLLTVPLAAWGLLRTARPLTRPRVRDLALAALLYVLTLGAFFLNQHSASQTVGFQPAALDKLGALAPTTAKLPAPPTFVPLSAKRAFPCKRPPLSAKVTLLAMFVRTSDGKPHATCKQGDDLGTLVSSLRKQLSNEAFRGPIAVDVIESVTDLAGTPSWLSPLALRPGLDGVCLGTRCLAPWQLLARGVFVSHAPVSFLPEFRFGASHKQLRRWLKSAEPSDVYQRIATRSFVIDANGTLTPLRRLQSLAQQATPDAIEQAERAFESHILAAQQRDGKFRYALEPFSGRTDTRSFSIARQAGTAYALCDVGRAVPEVTETAKKALKFLGRFERVSEDKQLLGLVQPGDSFVSLGPSALSLVAFLRCRSRMENAFDDQIRGLSRFVVSLQAANGSFRPGMDLKFKTQRSGPLPLYSQGQAILALVLLESALLQDPSLLPDLGPDLRSAIDRAMDYTAGDYWQRAMYPFFFLEESWHCLAARAALVHHRRASYERFCLDYVSFKSRLILEASSDVDPEFIGGFGVGNIFPPHSAGAAGFGEAVAAALTIERARGESTLRERHLMEAIVHFVLRSQRTDINSFACVPESIGGFPEQVHSPVTRIDFAQHAWSAIANARSELAW